MMLLAPVGARKNTGAGLCKTSVVVGVNVFYAFIDKIQIDLMAGIEGRSGKTMNGLSTGV
jgi:hypothetical protein